MNAKPGIIGNKLIAVFALFLLLSVVISCRMLESLGGGENAGTVSELWPDVPPLAGATKADLQIPLGARLALRAMMQGKINFIAYTTDKSAQEVKDYYTNERMKEAGWTPTDKGCIGDMQDEKNKGVACFYQRKDSDKQEVLAIIVAQDDKTKHTDLFYARIDATPTPSPKK